jgi:hypothetical protein
MFDCLFIPFRQLSISADGDSGVLYQVRVTILGGFIIGDDIGGCGSDDKNSGKNGGGQQHDSVTAPPTVQDQRQRRSEGDGVQA